MSMRDPRRGPWIDFAPPPLPRDPAPVERPEPWRRHTAGDGHPGQRALRRRREQRRNRRGRR